MGPAKTIGIDLWAGQSRGGHNLRTCYRQATRDGAPKSMQQLFIGAYQKFGSLCRDVDEPGLALLAVDELTGKPAGLVRLRARPGRHVAAIVGRHDECDLYLSGHSSLALRHLAIVLDPVQSWSRNSTAVRYHVLDLRTESGFTDEHGKEMRGLRAEGPAFMRCAGHAIFVMPLGDPSDAGRAGRRRVVDASRARVLRRDALQAGRLADERADRHHAKEHDLSYPRSSRHRYHSSRTAMSPARWS